MRRPRIALWIKWRGVEIPTDYNGQTVFPSGRAKLLWCPQWLWRWAVRRVDKWHEEQYEHPLDAVNRVFHEKFGMPFKKREK